MNTAFDVTIADPPYGIREAMINDGISMNLEEENPFVRLIECIAQDRQRERPLLRKMAV